MASWTYQNFDLLLEAAEHGAFRARVTTSPVGENAFPDQPPGLTLPITPDWVEITAAEAAGAN